MGLPTVKSYSDNQLLLLDRYGLGIVSIYFDSEFTTPDKDPSLANNIIDISNWLLSPQIGAYVSADSLFYRITTIATVGNGSLINYRFLLLTSDTPVYDITVSFNSTSKQFSNQVLNAIYNTYGGQTV